MKLPDWINFEKWAEAIAGILDKIQKVIRPDPPAEPWQAPNEVTKVKRKK